MSIIKDCRDLWFTTECGGLSIPCQYDRTVQDSGIEQITEAYHFRVIKDRTLQNLGLQQIAKNYRPRVNMIGLSRVAVYNRKRIDIEWRFGWLHA